MQSFPFHFSHHILRLLLLAVFPVLVPSGLFAKPEIAHIHPNYRVAYDMPLVVTGEGFGEQELRAVAWAPPTLEKEQLLESLKSLDLSQGLDLPSSPPDADKLGGEVRGVKILDLEEQVLLLENFYNHRLFRPAVLWVKSSEGTSSPQLLNVARPKWINQTRIHSGELLRIFGFGLRVQYQQSLIALRKGDQVINLPLNRTPFFYTDDPRTLEAFLPMDLEPGPYEVFIHNGGGGQYGWALAGEFELVAASAPAQEFSVKDFGARGDGFADDGEAIEQAITAAAEAGGGVVLFPPGTYVTTSTIIVQTGVEIRGADPNNTVIRGEGYEPGAGRNLRSVVALQPGTALEKIGVTGAVDSGAGVDVLVKTIEGSHEHLPKGFRRGLVRIQNVRLERPYLEKTGRFLYRDAFRAAGGGWNAPVFRVEVLQSEFNGNVMLGHSLRCDVVGNKIQHGAVQAGALIDAFIADNIMFHRPERFFSYRPVINTNFARNQVVNFGMATSGGTSESFMLHGGHKQSGDATSASQNSLTVTGMKWEPDALASGNSMVLITAGKGFGQYRRVIGNTEDTLRVDPQWNIVPDETSEYSLGAFFADSAFTDNYNSGEGRMSLWLDCIHIVVERHKDDQAGGIDIWGADRSKGKEQLDRFNPSWFNILANNTLERSRIFLVDYEEQTNRFRGPTLFANTITGNNVVEPGFRNVGMTRYPTAGIDVGTSIREGISETWRSGNRSSHTIVTNNSIADAETGIRIPKGARTSFLSGNTFERVEHPIMDFGTDTIWQGGNTIRRISPETGQLESRALEPAEINSDNDTEGLPEESLAPPQEG